MTRVRTSRSALFASRLGLLLAGLHAGSAAAIPVHYTLDPNHSFPSFAAPHIAGISIWRGKFDHTEGTVTLDRAAHSGSMEITVDTGSIDFGHTKMNEHARSSSMFDASRFPKAVFKSDQLHFDGDRLVAVDGSLSLHGVTRPLHLTVDEFKCITHPILHREVCGADATAELDRSAFGIDEAVSETGSPMVQLQIQVEAIADPVDDDPSPR